MANNSIKSFSKKIVSWYHKNKRDLPWRKSSDPYIIWLSEVILQQTRVEQGLPYFEKFVAALPDVKKFAAAGEDAVLKLWQGLGYYSRARNMLVTANQVAMQHGGKFPQSFSELKKLKGIGDYTAAAIASFAFNLPHAVVDGNVYRLLSRYFGIDIPIDSSQGKNYFAQLANELLDSINPAMHNQAIMELGSIVCKPKNPLCAECPLNVSCVALEKNSLLQLPVKSKTTKVTDRYFYYFLIKYKNKVIINKRGAKDIWQNLYDLPLIETQKKMATEKIFITNEFKMLLGDTKFIIKKITPQAIHKLSHQNIHAVFISINCESLKIKMSNNMKQLPLHALHSLAYPRLIEKFLTNEKLL